jgi:hypothetical protein
MLAETLPGPWMEATADAVDRAVENVIQANPTRRATRWAVFLAKELFRATVVLQKMMRDEIDAGVEATSFAAEAAPWARQLDQAYARLERVLQRMPSRASDSGRRRVRELLLASERQLFEARQYLAKYLEAAQKPLPCINQESLRRGRADAAAGRTEKVQDALDRLEADGEV